MTEPNGRPVITWKIALATLGLAVPCGFGCMTGAWIAWKAMASIIGVF